MLRPIYGFIQLSRPKNAFAASVLTLIGFILSLKLYGTDPLGYSNFPNILLPLIFPHHSLIIVGSFFATFFATTAGNVINDYFDNDIDKINAPNRPIPIGSVSKSHALLFSVFLFFTAFIFCLFLPPFAITIAIINFALLILYTPFFKRRPFIGNIIVSYLGGSTILFGSASLIGSGVFQNELFLILFFLIFLSTYSREVIKDIEDMEGDNDQNLKTLPLTIGVNKSILISSSSLLLSILISPLPFIMGVFGASYLFIIAVADVLMILAIFASMDDPKKGQIYLKYGMFVAIFSFIVAGIF